MVVWALGRLLPEDTFARLCARRLLAEGDPEVRREWDGLEAPAATAAAGGGWGGKISSAE